MITPDRIFFFMNPTFFIGISRSLVSFAIFHNADRDDGCWID